MSHALGISSLTSHGIADLSLHAGRVRGRCILGSPRCGVGAGRAARRGLVLVGQRHGDDGALSQVVLDGNAAVLELDRRLHHGKPRTGASYVALHCLGGAGERGAKGRLLVGDTRSLVGERDGLTPVHDGYRRFDELGVDVVFNQLTNDVPGPVASLLGGELPHVLCDLVEVGAHVAGRHRHHARRHCHGVIYGYAGRLLGRDDLIVVAFLCVA